MDNAILVSPPVIRDDLKDRPNEDTLERFKNYCPTNFGTDIDECNIWAGSVAKRPYNIKNPKQQPSHRLLENFVLKRKIPISYDQPRALIERIQRGIKCTEKSDILKREKDVVCTPLNEEDKPVLQPRSTAPPQPVQHSNGYPSFSVNNKRLLAKRLVYLWFVDDLPENGYVKTRCGKQLCVNPHHLYIFGSRRTCFTIETDSEHDSDYSSGSSSEEEYEEEEEEEEDPYQFDPTEYLESMKNNYKKKKKKNKKKKKRRRRTRRYIRYDEATNTTTIRIRLPPNYRKHFPPVTSPPTAKENQNNRDKNYTRKSGGGKYRRVLLENNEKGRAVIRYPSDEESSNGNVKSDFTEW